MQNEWTNAKNQLPTNSMLVWLEIRESERKTEDGMIIPEIVYVISGEFTIDEKDEWTFAWMKNHSVYQFDNLLKISDDNSSVEICRWMESVVPNI